MDGGVNWCSSPSPDWKQKHRAKSGDHDEQLRLPDNDDDRIDEIKIEHQQLWYVVWKQTSASEYSIEATLKVHVNRPAR